MRALPPKFHTPTICVRKRQSPSRATIGVAAAAIIGSGVISIAPLLLAQEPALHESALGSARVSGVSASEVVITLDATGDLRGLLTVKLDLAPDGSIAGGEWALVSSYVEDLNPDGTPVTPEEQHEGEEPHDHEAPHQEFVRLVDDGTLGGEVLTGSLTRGPDGAITLAGIQLALSSGTLTFASVTVGAGVVDLDLTQPEAQGTLRLTF